MKKNLYIGIFISLFLTSASPAAAETAWSQCPGGSSIVRCQTYDCPKGDTNSDGLCSLSDTDAKITDSRNDAFCANPLSGCGQVQYYAKDATAACTVRVKEAGSKCDLYKAGNPSFTPKPTATAKATATPKGSAKPSVSPTPTRSPKPANRLPETGPSLSMLLGLVAAGFGGIYLFDRFKTV